MLNAEQHRTLASLSKTAGSNPTEVVTRVVVNWIEQEYKEYRRQGWLKEDF